MIADTGQPLPTPDNSSSRAAENPYTSSAMSRDATIELLDLHARSTVRALTDLLEMVPGLPGDRIHERLEGIRDSLRRAVPDQEYQPVPLEDWQTMEELKESIKEIEADLRNVRELNSESRIESDG